MTNQLNDIQIKSLKNMRKYCEEFKELIHKEIPELFDKRNTKNNKHIIESKSKSIDTY